MPRVELEKCTLPAGVRFRQYPVIRIEPADRGRTRAGRRREITRPETHRFQPPARLCDRLDIAQPQRGFYHHFEADAFFALAGQFDLRHQHVERIHVGGDPDLGQKQKIEARTGFHHLDHIAIRVLGVEAVDAHTDRLAAPVDVVERRHHVLARARLVVGRHRIFKIEEYDVGGRAARLLDHFRVRRRHREFGAMQAGSGGFKDSETHGGLSNYLN